MMIIPLCMFFAPAMNNARLLARSPAELLFRCTERKRP